MFFIGILLLGGLFHHSDVTVHERAWAPLRLTINSALRSCGMIRRLFWARRFTPNKATVERETRAAHGMRAAQVDRLMPLDVMPARMRSVVLPNGTSATRTYAVTWGALNLR